MLSSLSLLMDLRIPDLKSHVARIQIGLVKDQLAAFILQEIGEIIPYPTPVLLQDIIQTPDKRVPLQSNIGLVRLHIGFTPATRAPQRCNIDLA